MIDVNTKLDSAFQARVVAKALQEFFESPLPELQSHYDRMQVDPLVKDSPEIQFAMFGHAVLYVLANILYDENPDFFSKKGS